MESAAARPPTLTDADAVAALINELDSPMAVDVLRVDWGREGFDLQEDAWLWVGRGKPRAFAALYPDGWAVAVCDEEQPAQQLLVELFRRAREKREPEIKLLVPSTRPRFLAALAEAGFREDERLTVYRGRVDASRETATPAWSISAAAGEGDERLIHEIVARAYDDLDDFEAWRRWITSWERDPELWLVARAGDRIVGALVAFVLPWEGWVKRVVVVDSADADDVGGALLTAACRRFAERRVARFGLPVSSDDPVYLPGVASAAGLVVDDERFLLVRDIDL